MSHMLNKNQKDLLISCIEKLFQLAYVPVKVSLSEHKDNVCWIVLQAENPEDIHFIIGKEGRTLDTFQRIIQNHLSYHILQDQPHMQIVLDIENYRTHREETLIKLALDSADWVLSHHRSKLLDLLPPFERKIIHVALSDVDGITTESLGNGYLKSIQIRSSKHHFH